MEHKHQCCYCSKEFASKRKHSKFCSNNCSKKYHYKHNPKFYMNTCKNCGEIFGYKELCMLADALKIFENTGFDQVYQWCDLLNESEDC